MQKDFSKHNIAQRTKRGARNFTAKHEETLDGCMDGWMGETRGKRKKRLQKIMKSGLGLLLTIS